MRVFTGPKNTWLGQPVRFYEGNLRELAAHLPEFELWPFCAGDDFNPDLAQVVKRPDAQDERQMPVGVVSRYYRLVQHKQLVEWLVQVGIKMEISEEEFSGVLYLSTYGERMLLEVELKQYQFDPGDGNPTRIICQCQNSVETSLALEISLGRLRLVCSNGMMDGRGVTIRKNHLAVVDSQQIVSSLRRGIEAELEDQKRMVQWYNTSLNPGQLGVWADQVVAKKWGDQDAARLYNIAISGYDGQPSQKKGFPPSKWPFESRVQVPGACAPVKNIYHASQALSWIASREPKIEKQRKRMGEIYELIQPLMERLN